MKFSPSFLDELRARVPVSDVVRQKVKLKKQGREWRGLSPFNAEKTPSFYVNEQKGFFHDFSSGKSGDGIAFLMETEGISFPEAVEKLAGMAGLPMPVETSEEREYDRKRASLTEVVLAISMAAGSIFGAPNEVEELEHIEVAVEYIDEAIETVLTESAPGPGPPVP